MITLLLSNGLFVRLLSLQGIFSQSLHASDQLEQLYSDILNHLPVAGVLDNQCVCCGSCERTLAVFTFLAVSQLSIVTDEGVSCGAGEVS